MLNISFIFLVHKIRLSQIHVGFVEIKDGSTWRKVKEKNWDRNRQKMLCKHLGFEESANLDLVFSEELRSVETIVTGDLICYNTQPSRTSCCAHLHSSTTNSYTNLTVVNCKYSVNSK